MRGPIKIDWEELLPDTVSSPRRGSGGAGGDEEVCFVSLLSPPPKTTTAAAASRTEEEAEVVGMKDGELRREIAKACRLRGPFERMLSDGGEGNRRRGALLEAEARRRGIETSAKDGDGCRSAAHDVFKFDTEDHLGEYASRKFYGESSPVCSTKKNYGQLGVKTHRSLRQIGQRKPISVDKMYSSKPCSSTLYGHKLRVHAIDPEEKADDEKCRVSERYNLRKSTKRRKEHWDSCFPGFRKVQDVVLLDDEDVQPEEQVDCAVHEKQNESKIYYPSRDDPEAVDLSSSDIKCLDPGVYLSSPVINYYIQYIKRTKLRDDDFRDRFYICNTYFYSKIEEALSGKGELVKLRRWWKGVNIYQRAYIILPIHGSAHWSLIIICIPSKESNSGPIILHLDSLEIHHSAKIFDTVAKYLEAEWCHLQKNPPPDISISETIWEDLPRNILKEKVQVPQQNNAYDCGIFMLYYIERFIREAPERFTRDNLDMFSRSWFQSEDASGLRHRIRVLLQEEFESARLEDAISEEHTSNGSDNEDVIKGADSEAETSSDSSAMIIDSGDAGISNKDIKKVAASEEASSSICRSADKLTSCFLSEAATFSDNMKDGDNMKADTNNLQNEQDIDKLTSCVLSEAATFSDNMKDEEDIIKADPDSSQNEQDIAVLSFGTWKNNEGVMHTPREPNICFDSSDCEMEDVKIIEAPTKRTNQQKCWIS